MHTGSRLFSLCFAIVIITVGPHPLLTALELSIQDEVTMSQYIGNSASPEKLRLFLKLFPNSPYSDQMEANLFQIERKALSYEERSKVTKLEKVDINFDRNSSLTGVDEVTMSRVAQASNNPKMYRLFLKVFPFSSFATIFRMKLSRLEKRVPSQSANQRVIAQSPALTEDEIEETQEAVKKIEKEILAEEPPPLKTTEEENEPQVTEPKEELKKQTKPEEQDEPEGDWSKIEIGIPTSLTLTSSGGSEIETTGPTTGFYLSWASEDWFDAGTGTGLIYFTQELEDGSGEYQHLFWEAQIKGRILKYLNWGLGYGYGWTTFSPASSSSTLTIVPGTTTIWSFSFGARYGSLGLNITTSSFSGAYSWVESSGSKGDVDWSGTLNSMTAEFSF